MDKQGLFLKIFATGYVFVVILQPLSQTTDGESSGRHSDEDNEMMPQDRIFPDKGKSEQQDKVRYN